MMSFPNCQRYFRAVSVIGLLWGGDLTNAQHLLLAQSRTLNLERSVPVHPSSGPPAPEWSGSLLLSLGNRLGRQIQLEATDGAGNTTEVPFEIPGATQLTVLSVGAGTDRTIVVGGIAFSGDSRGSGFVAWISPDRKNQTVVRTERFFAYAVTRADDGKIWAAGHEWQDADFKVAKNNVFRQYAASGELTNTFIVPRATAKAFVSGDATQASKLMPAMDRVGWFTNGGEYFEFSLAGGVIGVFDAPPGTIWGKTYAGAALSDSGELVVGVRGPGGTQLSELDRTAKNWLPISLSGAEPQRSHVYGFDGETLITQSQQGELRRYALGTGTAQ